MPFDEDAEDEPSDNGPVPLPPEDRLWRHPSELGPEGPGLAGASGNPLAMPWPPVVGLDPASAADGRRSSWASVAAVSCLAGAVITMGVVLATRPATKVVQQRATRSAVRRPVTSVAFRGFPTEQVAAQVTKSVARLDVDGPAGWHQSSAVLVSDDGTLVTSAELVRGSRKLVVTFDHDHGRVGSLAYVDSQTGIAVIKVDDLEGRTGASAATTRPSVGEPSVMVGGPGPGSATGTVTTANVRGLGREMEGASGALHDLIELDRPVVDDTTGGALVDAGGKVLGICLQGKASKVGYAMPIGLVRKVVDPIRTGDRVRWGWLGVKATSLDPGTAQELDISGAAVLVSIDDDSPAARAGLKKGDLITRLASIKVESSNDLVAALSEHHPGDVVGVQLLRDSSPRSVQVTLGTK